MARQVKKFYLKRSVWNEFESLNFCVTDDDFED